MSSDISMPNSATLLPYKLVMPEVCNLIQFTCIYEQWKEVV